MQPTENLIEGNDGNENEDRRNGQKNGNEFALAAARTGCLFLLFLSFFASAPGHGYVRIMAQATGAFKFNVAIGG